MLAVDLGHTVPPMEYLPPGAYARTAFGHGSTVRGGVGKREGETPDQGINHWLYQAPRREDEARRPDRAGEGLPPRVLGHGGSGVPRVRRGACRQGVGDEILAGRVSLVRQEPDAASRDWARCAVWTRIKVKVTHDTRPVGAVRERAALPVSGKRLLATEDAWESRRPSQHQPNPATSLISLPFPYSHCTTIPYHVTIRSYMNQRSGAS